MNIERKVRNIIIRSFKPKDLERITEMFYKEYGKETFDTYESFKWQLIDNPIQPQVAWVAYDTKKRQMAAYYQLLIQRFCVRGQTVLAALSLNTLIDKSYRSFSWRDESGSLTNLFLTLAKCAYDEAKELGVSFIWIVPNEKSSEGFFKYLNFHKVQSLTLGIRPSKPSLILPDCISNPVVGGIVGKLFDLLRPLFFPNFFFSKGMIFRQINIENVDDAVNLACEAYQLSNLYQIRDKEYMRWRYFESPRSYSLHGLYNKRQELLAWCVTTVIKKGDSSFGIYYTGIITDFCFTNNVEGFRFGKLLLKHTIGFLAKNKNISLILILYNASSSYKALFKKRDFIVLPKKYEPRKFPLGIRVFDSELSEIVSDPRSWSIYSGDYDVV